jgi:outer membrane protein TolC
MEENHENTRKLYKETKAYYENGFREEQDVDQIRLMVKKAENEIIKAKREINISKIVLKYAMGYPIESQISLTENLDQFLVPLFEEKSGIGFDHSTHIDYKLSETNYLVSKKLLNLEKAAFLPRISMFYNWNKTAYSDNSNLFKSTASWFPSSMLGFNISVPIFNSGQKYLKVKQAQIDVNKAAVDKTFATVTLQKNYLTAKAELETAIEKFGNDKENRTLSEKILGKAKIKFNNGITSSTELSQIETQYIQTYGAYIGSALQLLQADLSLKKALGKL